MCQTDKHSTISQISSKNSEFVPGLTPSQWNTLPPCTINPCPCGFNCSPQLSTFRDKPCMELHTTFPFTPQATTIRRLLLQMLIASVQFQKQWEIDSKICPHNLQLASQPRELNHSPTSTALWLRSHNQAFIFSSVYNAHSLLQKYYKLSFEMPLSFQLLWIITAPTILEPVLYSNLFPVSATIPPTYPTLLLL